MIMDFRASTVPPFVPNIYQELINYPLIEIHWVIPLVALNLKPTRLEFPGQQHPTAPV